MVPELRLAASANIDNVRSNRLIRRLGFHPAGLTSGQHRCSVSCGRLVMNISHDA